MRRRAGVILMLLAYVVSTCPGCASAPAAAPAVPGLPTAAAPAGGPTVNVSVPPDPCCPHPTLWEFLGVKGLIGVVGGGLTRLRNRLGSRFPGLEAKPPVLAITDPANMGPNAPPAVKAAAEAKAYEDQAAQKIKGIRYLATLGCTTCFPDIEKALLAALEDCTEAVRYEGVLAIRTLSGGPCAQCLNNRCCSPAIIKKLDELANKTNEQGCYLEPSARVRRVARLGLAGCGNSVAPNNLPTEGPPDDLPAPDPNTGAPPVATFQRLPNVAQQTVMPVNYQTPILAARESRPVRGDETRGQQRRDTVLAEVNGQPIFESEIATRLVGSSLREQLELAIDRKLIAQAARRVGFVPVDAPGANRPASYQAQASTASEAQLIGAWLENEVRVDTQVSRQEAFAFYRQNLDRFQPPAEVRFEYLGAPLAQYGTRETAHAVVAYLRDKAQRLPVTPPPGVDLSRVTTTTYEWTRRDALSPELANCLFALPVGTLSPILYDESGACMVRVLDRRQARGVALEDATPAIEREIVARRRAAAERSYVDYLRENARIWTVLDRAPHDDFRAPHDAAQAGG